MRFIKNGSNDLDGGHTVGHSIYGIALGGPACYSGSGLLLYVRLRRRLVVTAASSSSPSGHHLRFPHSTPISISLYKPDSSYPLSLSRKPDSSSFFLSLHLFRSLFLSFSGISEQLQKSVESRDAEAYVYFPSSFFLF